MAYFYFQHFFEVEPLITPSVHICTDMIEKSPPSPPSLAESALAESIPSTPEVQLDNLPPNFCGREDVTASCGDNSTLTGSSQRRLSHDSGLCELEGQNSADEQITQAEEKSDYHSDLINTADESCDSDSQKTLVLPEVSANIASCSLDLVIPADPKPNGLVELTNSTNLDQNSNAQPAGLHINSQPGSTVVIS